MDNLDELLGIDRNDPMQQHASELVEATYNFQDQLRLLRVQAGITPYKVAENLGWTESQVYEVEHGDPSLSEIRLYALAIGAAITFGVRELK